MWETLAQTDRPKMIVIRRIGFCVWMTKATNTHSEYIIVTALYFINVYANASQCYVTRTLPVLCL